MSDLKCSAVVIGITGGIACGKSEVGRFLGKMGFSVCDADHVAHTLMNKGTPVFRKIVDHFGEKILLENGELSRLVLGKIVFKDSVQRKVLNELVHPAVQEALAAWIVEQRLKNTASAVLVPLLFESGMQDLDWDAIVCVTSPKVDVLQRLEKRGLTLDEAEQRIRAQMPLSEKKRRADSVLSNTGTLAEFELATRIIVKAIIG